MRCFIALELPYEIREELKKIQDLIKKKNFFTGKFTEPENFHLTLKFLGDVDEEILEEIKKRLKQIDFSEFYSYFGNMGVFSKKSIKIVWLEMKGKKLFELQKKIDEKLEELFEKEKRFRGHITIARVKKTPNKKDFLEYLEKIKPLKMKFKINNFYLMKSVLFPEGPIYSTLKEYNLKGKENID